MWRALRRDMKSKMPRIKDTDNGPRWMVDDIDVAGVGGGGLTGTSADTLRGQSKLLDKMDDVESSRGSTREYTIRPTLTCESKTRR